MLDKSLGWGGYGAVRRALGGRRFDALLHMHASARANLVSLVVASPLRIGFDRARARDYQWLFCNKHLEPKPRAARNGWALRVRRADRRPAAAGADLEHPGRAPSDEAFAAAQIPAGTPALVISPCTGQRFRNYRNWRVDWYAEIADYAETRYGARVLLTGGTTEIERTYGRGILELCKSRPTNLIGQTSLKQLLAILKRSSVVLCPDSGPAHMATSVRTPVVGLYATSNRLRTGPYFSQHLVVDKYPEAVDREFHRPVNELRWGQRVRDPEAMSLITVADVTRKLDMAFAERGIAPLD